MNPRGPAPLAPFAVRSFRFQWPADLLASWAFEMENLILGWYILVETESVFLLTLYASLQFLGTLLAPFFGVAGDQLGRRRVLCAIRALYGVLASVILTFAMLGVLTPWHVFPIAFLMGLVRPSDLVMRNSLIGDTMPPESLISALSLARTTMDTARIIGALAGAGLFAALGIGPAYLFVVAFYAASFALSLGVSGLSPAGAGVTAAGATAATGLWASRLRDLRDGISYVWNTPAVLALMWLAFLINLTAIPMSHGLLAFVAKDVYGIDETGLSHLVAGFASGALAGSIVMALIGARLRSPRFTLINMAIWYALLAVFGQLDSKAPGLAVLVAVGFFSSLAMISLAGMLLRAVSARFRGRVMGLRMLAVYGLPVGLLSSSAAIGWIGYPATVSLYVVVGVVFTALIGYRWRRLLWRGDDAPDRAS